MKSELFRNEPFDERLLQKTAQLETFAHCICLISENFAELGDHIKLNL